MKVPNILTLSENQHFVWYNTSRCTKWKDMLQIWRHGRLATPISRNQSGDFWKSWSNL